MKKQLRSLILTLILTLLIGPAAVAADISDIGYVDQAALANLPPFVNANRELLAYKQALDAQFNAAIRNAKSDADKQRISMQFQQQYSDKQHEIAGPLFTRAQLAIAQVSAARNLSVIVDKRIVIYGGQDITRDVQTLFSSGQAISPPAATPPPSEIGFVDQSILDGLPKVKSANDEMNQFASTERAIFAPKVAQARSDAEKQQIYQQFNTMLSNKQEQLLKPLVDQTKTATADVARKKNILLVVDRADVIYGGTDITTDVQNELTKS
ncbi:MAG: OmpH family outer membrane protein [Candidatus Eremiobacteraeota bacterium]|nr:OmpH family outer membrane protein [Candidatus Eremiobacteraeota bacterium]